MFAAISLKSSAQIASANIYLKQAFDKTSTPILVLLLFKPFSPLFYLTT